MEFVKIARFLEENVSSPTLFVTFFIYAEWPGFIYFLPVYYSEWTELLNLIRLFYLLPRFLAYGDRTTLGRGLQNGLMVEAWIDKPSNWPTNRKFYLNTTLKSDSHIACEQTYGLISDRIHGQNRAVHTFIIIYCNVSKR